MVFMEETSKQTSLLTPLQVLALLSLDWLLFEKSTNTKVALDSEQCIVKSITISNSGL